MLILRSSRAIRIQVSILLDFQDANDLLKGPEICDQALIARLLTVPVLGQVFANRIRRHQC